MKILIPVKRGRRLQRQSQSQAGRQAAVDTANVRCRCNPFDEIAVGRASGSGKGDRHRDRGVSCGWPRAGNCARRWRSGRPPTWSRPCRIAAAGGAKLLKAVVTGAAAGRILGKQRSTTMPTRPARCSPRCSAGPRHVRLEVEIANGKAVINGKSTVAWRRSRRRFRSRSPPTCAQRAGLRDAAEHHEPRRALETTTRRPGRGCHPRLKAEGRRAAEAPGRRKVADVKEWSPSCA